MTFSVETSQLQSPVGEIVPPRSASPATSAAVPDEREVRMAIGRFESAYNRLDVGAAAAIWPSVDRRALARAFDGLQSQRITMTRCLIDVSGSSARAACAGTVQWTPRFGGRPQVAPRRWDFVLRRSGDGWTILSAAAR